jgi:hypothetical protein
MGIGVQIQQFCMRMLVKLNDKFFDKRRCLFAWRKSLMKLTRDLTSSEYAYSCFLHLTSKNIIMFLKDIYFMKDNFLLRVSRKQHIFIFFIPLPLSPLFSFFLPSPSPSLSLSLSLFPFSSLSLCFPSFSTSCLSFST